MYMRKCAFILVYLFQDDYKMHISRNHDIPIACQLCESKYTSKRNYERHLRSQMHRFNLEHNITCKKQRAPYVTVTISSDEGEVEDKDVFSTDDGENKEEDVKNVELNMSDEDGKKREEFLKGVNIVKGKETKDGTSCKVCKKVYKHLLAHCKTGKHIQAFKNSKLYQQMSLDEVEETKLSPTQPAAKIEMMSTTETELEEGMMSDTVDPEVICCDTENEASGMEEPTVQKSM